MPDDDLARYLQVPVEGAAMRAKVTDPRTVVTAPWVRLKCQFGCKDQTWCCPPYTPTPAETRAVLDCYRRCILYNFQVKPEDNSRKLSRSIHEALTKLEGDIFKDGYYKAFLFKSGPCLLCPECGLKTGKECIVSALRRPSMEGCGIDVFQTARNNGFFIATLKTRQDLRNHFCLMLVD